MSSGTDSILASESLKLLANTSSACALDVRSEGEVLNCGLPKFTNIPILNNDERHHVGLCYKINGSEAAVELGHRLIGEHRDQRIEMWCRLLRGAEWPLITCWRGGLRSKIAAEWIRQTGQPVIRIDGGYKALRNILLETYSKIPRLLVVVGPTGSQKTQLIEQSGVPHVNLEELAKHRGSVFGGLLNIAQPHQATFENAIGFKLLQLEGQQTVLVEDESPMIGQVRLPANLTQAIKQSLVVKVHVGLEQRVENILTDYVTRPLKEGVDCHRLQLHYEECLSRIQRKLGGQMHAHVLQNMKSAFRMFDEDLHRQWIRDLLQHYYDKTYLFSELKLVRKIIFEGDWQACQNWLKTQFV